MLNARKSTASDTCHCNDAIGWFAFRREDGRNKGFFEDDSLVITGKRESLVKRIANQPSGNWKYTMTCFGDLYEALMEGYAIAFDTEAYRNFTPLAKRLGLALCPDAPEQISRRDGFEDPLILVQLDLPGFWINDEFDGDEFDDDEFDDDEFDDDDSPDAVS